MDEISNSANKNSNKYNEMRLITPDEYRDFLLNIDYVEIENTKVLLQKEWKISIFQPLSYSPEEWTGWSFPDRGDWATHKGNYREILFK